MFMITYQNLQLQKHSALKVFTNHEVG